MGENKKNSISLYAGTISDIYYNVKSYMHPANKNLSTKSQHFGLISVLQIFRFTSKCSMLINLSKISNQLTGCLPNWGEGCHTLPHTPLGTVLA